MIMVLAAIGVVFAAVFVYVMIMIFLPEWVGITGKVAKEAERSHRGGEAGSDDVIAKLQGKSHYLESPDSTSNPKSKKD